MKRKKIHLVAMIFFVIAFLFYFLAENIAIVFGVLGMVSELAAWVAWVLEDKSDSVS